VLKAGAYSSRQFVPKVTYTVPGGGWANYTDETGTYSLAPPGVSLAEAKNAVNIVLLWTNVQAPEMNCSTIPNAKVPQTVTGILKWLKHQKRLVTTKPRRVTIGGLKGYTLTVHVAHGRGMSCGVPVLMGSGISGNGGFNLGNHSDRAKLYLLTFETLPLGVIADSGDRHAPSLAEDSHVIKSFHFAKS
jgi:hypothetical protein